MNRATPKVRDFAERLIAVGMTGTPSSASKPSAVFAVFDKLRPCMAQIVGDLGFRAVLLRALAIASAEVAWLRAVHVKPDGSFEGTNQLGAIQPKELDEGKVVLLAEFVNLLVQLIGERLVLQLVHQALPKVSKGKLYFGKGS